MIAPACVSTTVRPFIAATLILGAFWVPIARAEIESTKIGFAPNHVFESPLKGEHIDVMNGNLNLQFPIGQKFMLNDWFGYQIQLFYNSKLWQHDCDIFGGPDDPCPGDLIAPDNYGLGFLLHFGRVYRDPNDMARLWRYQEPNGAEHFFCKDDQYGTCDIEKVTFDEASIKLEGGGVWTAKPGDGTIIYFEHDAGDYDPTTNPDGGWYATRIETIQTDGTGAPLQYVTIKYDEDSPWTNRIEEITDSADRVITFASAAGNDIVISVPKTPQGTADYILRFQNWTITDPYYNPLDGHVFQTDKRVLTEIVLPDLDATETHRFDYSPCGDVSNCLNNIRLGYLRRWTLPTDAFIDYRFKHFKTTLDRPFHSELVLKKLTVPDDPGSPYIWTYTRFGDGVVRTEADLADYNHGLHYSASNPSKVRVIDPFANLTVYWFHRTSYVAPGGTNCELVRDCESASTVEYPGECDFVVWKTECGSPYDHLLSGSCSSTGCPSHWTDGLLYGVETYAGPEENSNRLVRRETYNHVYDSTMVQLRPGGVDPDPNSMGVNVRQMATEVEAFGSGPFPTTSHRTEFDDWTHQDAQGVANSELIPRAREKREYENSVLYRRTVTNYLPVVVFHDYHTFVELYDPAGILVSRTQKNYWVNRLVEERKCALPEVLTTCQAADDVLTERQYDGTTGSLGLVTISGGDDQRSYQEHYSYDTGALAEASYDGMSWKAVDNDVDSWTGRVVASRSPSLVETTYSWDALGRLTSVDPAGEEAPVTVEYVDLLHTTLRQDPDPSGGDNYTESKYTYDALGRLVMEERRNPAGAYDFQKTEYDIAGRVTRQSEWAPTGTPDEDLDWTVTEYTLFGGAYADPLGRVSRVTLPDGSVTETEYDGLATTVTTYGIEGPAGPIDSTSEYVNDVFGRLIAVDSPGTGADANYFYDELDNLVEVHLTDPAGAVEGVETQIRRFSFDALSRLRVATNPESGTVEYLAYDPRGKLLHHRDARGNEFVQDYDEAGRLVSTTLDPGGHELVSNTYDVYDAGSGLSPVTARGHLTKQVSRQLESGALQEVATRRWGYGSGGSSVDCPYALPDSDSFSGLNGRLLWTKTTIKPWGGELTTDYCYNSLGAQSLVGYPTDGTGSMERSQVEALFRNGFVFEVHDTGRDLQYLADVTYGQHGSPVSFMRGNGFVNEIGRDSQGRPSYFAVFGPAQPSGTRESLDVLFGCNGGSGGGQPVELQYCGPPPSAPTVYEQFGPYAYDGAGNVSSIGADSFTYDQMSRLASAAIAHQGATYDLAYQYDAFGNMLSRGLAAQGGYSDARELTVDRLTNRLVELHSNQEHRSFSYDASGNLTADGQRQFVFNAENRLSAVWDVNEDLVARYYYDSSGYRLRSVVNGTETFYLRDDEGRVLSEFRRPEGAAHDPEWNKDYIYGLGQALTLVKNEIPAAPGRPWATGVTGTRLTVNWSPVDEPDIKYYLVEREITDPPGTTEFWVTAPAVTRLDDFGAAATNDPATAVVYRVKALDAAVNESAASEPLTLHPFDSTPPPAPGNVTGIPWDGAVQLTWDPVAIEDLAGFVIERDGPWDEGQLPPGAFVSALAMPVHGTEFVDPALSNGKLYQYRVRTVDTMGNVSSWVHTQPLMPHDAVPPARPQNVRAFAALQPNILEVRWDALLEPDVDHYEVMRVEPDEPDTLIATTSGTAHTDVQVVWGSDYTYQVRAYDSSGNPSELSQSATARPRQPATPPVIDSADFLVDDGGTAAAPPDPFNSNTCDTWLENDDTIGIRLQWDASPQTVYRVYRADSGTGDYAMVGTYQSDAAGGPVSYWEPSTGKVSYDYYIVEVLATSEESPASNVATAIDDFGPGAVRTLRGFHSAQDFTSDNARSRFVTIEWSKVHETQLQGYHVYRSCWWGRCQGHGVAPLDYGEMAPRTWNCIHQPVRLTENPVTQTEFTDETVGGLGGCWEYFVRPVSSDGTEGPAVQSLYVDTREDDWGEDNAGTQCHGGTSSDHWLHKSLWYDLWPEDCVPTLPPDHGSFLLERANAAAKGTGSPNGDPAPPVILPSNAPLSCAAFNSSLPAEGDHPSCTSCNSFTGSHVSYRKEGPDCGGLFPGNGCGKRPYYAWVRWQPNSESDLAGYHVEIAGSSAGPWERVTPKPVAWWENRFDLKGLWVYMSNAEDPVNQNGDPDLGCVSFRVTAVDEDGNESLPSETFDVPENCSEKDGNDPLPTPDPPENLMASIGTPASYCGAGFQCCATLLEWDTVPDATHYYVYRLKFHSDRYQYFYRTHIHEAAECAGGTCVYNEPGDIEPFGAPFISSEEFCPNEPYNGSDPAQRFHCRAEDGGLEVYYVTAVNVNDGTHGESPRSNVVFAHCRLPGSTEPLYSEADHPGADDNSWPTDAFATTAYPECPAVELDVVAGQSPLAPLVASDLSRHGETFLAPMLTLGQSPGTPPYKLLDLHVDHLGSTRLVTDDFGVVEAAHKYFPFGEEIVPQFDYNTKMFTGHERDDETGLDYMLGRYYGSQLARFWSVDPAARIRKSMVLPERWNRYSYAMNKPIMFIDPDGEDEIAFGSRRFEVYPGDVLVVRTQAGGLHTATYVEGGQKGEIIVVDNTSARNENLAGYHDGITQSHPDNTGNRHEPHDLLASVNREPSPFSPAEGATMVGVVPAESPATNSEVVQGAARIRMFHQDRTEQLQCSDFTLELDKELETNIGHDPIDPNEGPKAFTEPGQIDHSRDITP